MGTSGYQSTSKKTIVSIKKKIKKEKEKEKEKETEGQEEDDEKKEEEFSFSEKDKQIALRENNNLENIEIIDMQNIKKNENIESIDKNLKKEIINDEKNSNKNSLKNTINVESIKSINLNIINIKESKMFTDEKNDPIDYYIVCLRCKCRSPHIENINFDCNLMDINVSYYCACLSGCNYSQNESLKKLINSTKPLNLCPIHSNNTLKFYCNICKTFFCEKCQKDSEKHIEDLINFDIIMSLEKAEQIKNLLKKTKNKDVYNKIIDNYLNDLKKFNIPKYHLKRTTKLHDSINSITAIILLQSGLVATGSYDKTICIWNIKELSCDKKIKVLGKVLSLLEFKPNMLLSSQESIICLYNINSDKDECIYTFKGHELWVNCLIKYDDKTFASASNDHKIIIWDYEQRKKINEFEEYKNSIFSLIKLNDGNLCFGGADSEIRIFDWKKGRIINKLKGHSGWIMCLCQMDNETLLSGSDDKTIKVWKNNKCIFTIEGHSDMVKVLLKLNDNYFASGSFDKTIKIWKMEAFISQQTLTDHSSNILCLLKLNNYDLVSCAGDKSIKIWGKKNYLINYNKLPMENL